MPDNRGLERMNRYRIASVLAVLSALGPLAARSACDAPGTWMARVGGHNIDPTGKSSTPLGDAEVSSKFGPTFNIDYFFCRNFAIDILAALPYTHDISIGGTKIGTTQHLPPTVSLQYHPLADGRFDPFVGVGVNYTLFFNTSLNALPASLDLKNTWGYAFQAGVDYKLGGPWRIGADVRYINIEPKAYINGAEFATVDIDPIAYGVTLGYTF
jgi:outer membrane protein